MFFGEYEHSIDDKSRLTLPARFRDAFADGVVLTRGIDSCLDVFARADWYARVEERLAPLDPLSKEARQLMRHLFAAGTDAALDKQGRVLVPPALVTYAGLGREAVVAGVRDHLEIWNRTSWAAQVTSFEGSADDVAERLADKRL
ncbi:MAG: division/cell wall cluster transcriptional repressor MraZ [Actinobacteria bacterium]|nr:division/cell wall cluster transcriptional repressor MraZ [Actinomycetota bacterium]